MFREKSAVAVRDHFHFKFARLKSVGAELFEHRGQNCPNPCPQLLFQAA